MPINHDHKASPSAASVLQSIYLRWPLLVWLLMLSYAIWAHLWFGHNDVLIALNGWSVLDFTNWTLYPENFLRDYPGGSGFIGTSIVPHIYPLLKTYFGINPEITLRFMVGLEIITLSLSASYLLNTLFKNSRWEVSLCIMLLLALSWVRAANLANFGSASFAGTFYAFTDAVSLFAIACYLQKRYSLSALMLAFAFAMHPAKTFFATTFILGMHCWQWRKQFQLKILLPFTLLMGFILLWAIFWLDLFITGQAMSHPEFIKFSGLFNYHWYPESLGLFTSQSTRYAIPFLSAMLMLLSTLFRASINEQAKGQIFIGLLLLGLLSVAGLYIADHDSHPFLVKLCLQRSSELMLWFATIFTLAQTARDFEGSRWWYAVLGACSLACCFTSINSWPFSIAFVYAVTTLVTHRQFILRNALLALLLTLTALLSGFVLVNYHSQNIRSYILWLWLNWFLLASVITAVFFGINKILNSKPYFLNFARATLPLLLVAIACALAILWGIQNRTLTDEKIVHGHAAKDVQQWAFHNTQPGDLFAVDPCTAYGWRDYSLRGSWGTLQEWLKTGWLYTGDQKLLHEGIRRASSLGIDMSKDHGFDSDGKRMGASINSDTLCDTARNNFYLASGSTLMSVAEKYDIQYFVLINAEAAKYGGIPEWEIGYRNEYYTVIIPPTGGE